MTQTSPLLPQGMEVEDPECGESDPEEDGKPENEDLSQKGADGEVEVEAREEDEEGEESGTEDEQQEEITVDEEEWHTCSEDEDVEEERTAGSSRESSLHNSSRLLHKDELLDMFRAVHNGPTCKEGQLTVGLVGKSSYSKWRKNSQITMFTKNSITGPFSSCMNQTGRVS